MANPRSHLKRKAKKVAPVPVEHDELDLMKETLKPLEAWELEEWEGWVELESEPVCPLLKKYIYVYICFIDAVSSRHSSTSS